MPTNDDQNAWVKTVLGVTVNPTRVADFGLDDLDLDIADLWKAARAAFDVASAKVDKQIAALQTALRNSNDEELEEIADAGLNALTGNTRVPLLAALVEAGGDDPARVKAAAPALLKAVTAFRNHLDTDAKIAAADANPFGVAVAIRATFDGALDQLEEVAETIAHA